MKTKLTRAKLTRGDGRVVYGIAIHDPTDPQYRVFIGARNAYVAADLGQIMESWSTFEHGAMWCPDDPIVEFWEH